jgi:hypothetical protein
VNRQLDPTVDQLQRTMQAVADHVVDSPPPFVAVPVMPMPRSTRKRAALVAAACVVVLVVGVVAVALTRESGDGHAPVIEQPSVPTTTPVTTPPSLQHLVPGPEGTVTQVGLDGDAALPQPLEYQLGYAGTVDGDAAQLLITADDFSRTNFPSFTLENDGCDVDGDGSPRFPGTIVAIGSHQACLITNIQNALHLGWIDDDGVSVLLQSSGLSVEQLEALGASVERVPGDPLALRLRTAPPPGLTLVGEGQRPLTDSTFLQFDQGGCSYVVMTRLAAPVPFGFSPGAPPTTVRGAPGQVIGVGSIMWTSEGSTMSMGIRAQDVRTVIDHCDTAAVAETLVAVDDAGWEQLLASLGDRVQRTGGR